MKEKCLGPYTLEHTRPRLAHGSQASDGLVSTGEGDHSGILNVLGFLIFSFYFFIFLYFFFIVSFFEVEVENWKKNIKIGEDLIYFLNIFILNFFLLLSFFLFDLFGFK